MFCVKEKIGSLLRFMLKSLCQYGLTAFYKAAIIAVSSCCILSSNMLYIKLAHSV
jgi:hypothetical protein